MPFVSILTMSGEQLLRCEVCCDGTVGTVTEMMRDAGYGVPEDAKYVQVGIAAPRILPVADNETKVCEHGSAIGKTADYIWTLVLPASCGTQRVMNLGVSEDANNDSE